MALDVQSGKLPPVLTHPYSKKYMAKQFVKIANRGSYTSVFRAEMFVNRRMAEVSLICSTTKRVLEIRMLEPAELDAVRRRIRNASDDREVVGHFVWYVGDSGGSAIMKTLSARGTKSGVSGGYRVFKASHGGNN